MCRRTQTATTDAVHIHKLKESLAKIIEVCRIKPKLVDGHTLEQIVKKYTARGYFQAAIEIVLELHEALRQQQQGTDEQPSLSCEQSLKEILKQVGRRMLDALFRWMLVDFVSADVDDLAQTWHQEKNRPADFSESVKPISTKEVTRLSCRANWAWSCHTNLGTCNGQACPQAIGACCMLLMAKHAAGR